MCIFYTQQKWYKLIRDRNKDRERAAHARAGVLDTEWDIAKEGRHVDLKDLFNVPYK